MNKINTLKESLQKLQLDFGVFTPKDWYNINLNQFITKQKIFQLESQTDFLNILKICYPNIHWKLWLFSSSTSGAIWENKLNQRNYFQEISEKLSFKKPKEWYNISGDKFASQFQRPFFFRNSYHQSIPQALIDLFPEYKAYTKIWNFVSVPQFWWNSINNQLIYLKRIENKQKIEKLEDWYNVRPSKLGYLTKLYKTREDLFKTLIPYYFWVPWKFSDLRVDVWNNIKNQRYKINEIENFLKLKTLNNWYTTPVKKFRSLSTVYEKYYSINFMLQTIYPEYIWVPWNFINVTKHFFKDVENQKLFFKYLEKSLNIKNLDDWYKISSALIRSKNYTVFRKYNSTVELFVNIYPEKIWNPWKFSIVENGLWTNNKGIYYQRQFLNDISLNLNIKTLKDWYFVKFEDISKLGGISILKIYKSSILNTISDIYSEYKYIPWNFLRLPSNFWQNKSNSINFLKYCEIKLNIDNINQWNNISYQDVQKLGGGALLKNKSVNYLVKKYLVKKNLDFNSNLSLNPSISGKKSQHRLFGLLKKFLFQNQIIEQNYKHPKLFFKNTNKKIELDIFLPSLNLAFEYQGQHHYEKSNIFGTEEPQKKRDLEKQELCKNNSITLIQIPFNWDKNINSLKKIINSTRPDILI